jgi:hypothetical protein
MLKEREILAKLKIPEISDCQKLRLSLIDGTLDPRTKFGETNTQEFSPSLWEQPRILRLPDAELKRFYQLTVPLEMPYSYTHNAYWLTTETAFEEILKIITKYGIIAQTPYYNSKVIVDCQTSTEHPAKGIQLHYSYTGNDMGDGNVAIYLQLIPFNQKIYALPYNIIVKERIRKIVDAQVRVYHENEWLQETVISEEVHFYKNVHHFCAEHFDNAYDQILKYYQNRYRRPQGANLDTDLDLQHREFKSGQKIQEYLSSKVRVFPADKPTLIYDPDWVLKNA